MALAKVKTAEEMARLDAIWAELEAHKDELEEPKPDTRPQAEIDEENRKALAIAELKAEKQKLNEEKDAEIQRLENLCESYRIDCDNLAIREANAYKEIERADKKLRRHKYKRCLANAEAARHKRWRNDEGFDYARSTRHMKTWLELAEKFKPNSTAQ